MTSPPVGQRAFERMKAKLVQSHAGQFAVVCGRKLFGVFGSVDEALAASSAAFDAGELPPRATLFISEIAEEAALCVTARPYARGEARNSVAMSGQMAL